MKDDPDVVETAYAATAETSHVSAVDRRNDVEDVENAAEDEEQRDADERQVVAEQSGDPQGAEILIAAAFDRRLLVRQSPRMTSTECVHHRQSGEHEVRQDGALADNDAVSITDRRAKHYREGYRHNCREEDQRRDKTVVQRRVG